MNQRILIVDDHESLRRLVRDWLQAECPTCEVIEARSGEEAIAIAVEQEPSLVVMDIGLPGITGIEATRRLKEKLPSTPVVMLSVYEGQEYQDDARNAGASDFISKRRLNQDFLSSISKYVALERSHEVSGI